MQPGDWLMHTDTPRAFHLLDWLRLLLSLCALMVHCIKFKFYQCDGVGGGS